MSGHVTALHGWGRYPVVQAHTVTSEDLPRATEGAVLSRGLGRAYGDAALPPEGDARPVALSVRADRILSFDESTGVLRAEAGLSLSALARIYLARGWFSPVSPGTQYVTLGGMVAADIHGKNHHVHGTFGNFVRSLTMRVPDGRVVEVSREQHAPLFFATLGGMGLTGHILEVEVQLVEVSSPWIRQRSVQTGSLRETMSVLAEASATSPMTVSWIDTTIRGPRAGRGLVTWGDWADPADAPAEPPGARFSVPVPFTLPSGIMNRTTIRLMNRFYHWLHGPRPTDRVVHPGSFFWQLDLATDWYRGYGRRGFTQYQCVLPRDPELFDAFLDRFRALGGCSFVTVLKDCGEPGEGLLSFPKPGTTIAVDIPIRSVEATRRLVHQLNELVIANGGRVYLAKDALTSPEHFRQMYPRWEAFQAVRDEWDPDRRLASAQSVRLFGD